MNENEIDRLVFLMSKLPGFGKRSARRAVLHMINNKEKIMYPLAEAIQNTADNIKHCIFCGNFDVTEICKICSNHERIKNLVCVVENVGDLWSIERGKNFKGLYHVLGGTLSAIDGIGPENLNIESLFHKIDNQNLNEIILAINPTIEGQTTCHYLAEKLKLKNIKVTKLALGIPVGGELDYADDGTINEAFNSRSLFSIID